MGAGGLEPPEPEGEGFTVPCNCHYATPPNEWICWRKDLNPQPSAYKADALPLSYTSRNKKWIYSRYVLSVQEDGLSGGGICWMERLKKRETALLASGADCDRGKMRACKPFGLAISQHFLYFFPDPHGQGSFRPTFSIHLSH